MARRSWVLVIVAVLALVSLSAPAFAQVGTAGSQLTGTVRDATGGAVVKATVALRDMDTNRGYTATTNDSGFYILASVPPGRYELTVESAGFAKFTQTGIVLTVGETATSDVSLKVASGAEQVTVTTETPVIEPTKTEISQVVQPEQIQNLPISGRLFTDFALLTPGVATSRTSLGTTFTDFETTQISFGGMRSFSNEIMVDGADFVSMHTGVQRATPPQESVQEFRVVNNSFGTEYGRAAGGIVNIVTKGGTNTIHGSIYEYLQNSATDARSLLQPAPLPHELRENQFGGAVGGPVKKDKAFFYANYEGKRSAKSPTYPPDLVSGNNLQLVDDAKALMGLAPEGCFAALSACTGSDQSYINSFLKTENDDWGFARFDDQIGMNHHVGIRYSAEDTRALGELVGQTLDGGGIGVPSGGRNLFVRDQSVFGTLDSTIGSNLVNTALVQWARRHYNFPGATGQPDFSVTNDLELGHNFGTDDQKYESRVQFSDSLSWVKGNHVFKFGFDGNYILDSDTFPGFTPVRAIIPDAGGGPIDCLANFASYYNGLLATPAAVPADVAAAAPGCAVASDNGVVFTYAGTPLPTSATACGVTPCTPLVTTANPLNTQTWANAYPPSLFGNYTRPIHYGYWAGFAEDRWRITPKLTFNYGVRWEVATGLSDYVKPDYAGWQPRIGVAWSPDSKTVIRAGFGLFDDRYDMTFFFVPNTQKVVAGYLCGNDAPASIASACSAAGILPQNLTGIAKNQGQATQGYQLFGFPASQQAAKIAAGIIATGQYDPFVESPTVTYPGVDGGNIEMAGTCVLDNACGVGSGGMEYNSKLPYAEQASLEIDRQFGRGFALSASYLMVEAHHMVRGNNINIPCPVGTTKSGTPTDPLTLGPGGPPEWVPGLVNPNGSMSACSGAPTLGAGALAGLGPWFAGAAVNSGLQTISAGLMDYNNDVANAIYHGLNITGIEKIGQYFSLTANYTYSHTIDNGNFTTFINLPVNQFDYGMERANSNQDLRHRFVGNFTAQTPSKGWYRNFQLSGIITVETGRPFTIFYGNDTFGDIAGVATDRVGGAPLNTSCPAVQNCSTVISRNTYYGDGLRTVDLRISRAFHIHERQQVEFSVDAFNLFNRPNVDEVTSVYGSPVFCGGVVPTHYKDAASIAIQNQSASMICPTGGTGPVFPGAPPQAGALGPTPIPGINLFIPYEPNSNFGQPRTMFNPRQLQFGAKFTF